jgi:hypothetical protein
MKRIRFIPAIILCIVVVSLVIAIVIVQNRKKGTSHFSNTVGVLHIIKNENLQSNINTFMESQGRGDALGKDNYYCRNILYGYDDKYAYAWVYCSGFIVNNNNEIEQGTAFSIPTRLAYVLPNFQIIRFQQPMDDGLPPTLEQLFPESFYDLARSSPSDAELKKLEEEVKNQVKITNSDLN